jgi:S-disulfanyl-L-cysteine oxidoreductase SoxD
MNRNANPSDHRCRARRGRIASRGTLAAGALAFVASILAGSAPAHAFPWSIDMFGGASVQPLSVPPRVMPSGVLPVDGIHYDIHPGQPDGLPGIDEQALPEMKLETMTVKLHNPLQSTPVNLKHGQELFLANCSPCHGPGGKGDGSVVHLLAHKPANLMTGVSKNLPDGYIYGYIRNGGIWMPAYDDAMSSTERWQVVMYLRNLEQNYHEDQATATPSDNAAPASSSMPGMNMGR